MTLDELKQKAEKIRYGNDWFVAEGLAERLRNCDFSSQPEDDAAFIEAASPATVLTLLEITTTYRLAAEAHAHGDKDRGDWFLRHAVELERSL